MSDPICPLCGRPIPPDVRQSWHHLVPKLKGGPVVLLQIDNEAGYFFRNGPYCQDYHDDAVGLWHGYLAERHGDLAGTGEAHRESYASWAEVRPPVAFDAMEGGQLRPGALARQLSCGRAAGRAAAGGSFSESVSLTTFTRLKLARIKSLSLERCRPGW